MTRTAIAVTLLALGIGVLADDAGAAVNKRPDLTIRLKGGALVGNDVYAESGQEVRTDPPGPAKFIVRVQNDGAKVDSFRVFGIGTQTGEPTSKATIDTGGVEIRFRLQGKDVTRKVADGRLKFRNVPPGGSSPRLKMLVEADEGFEGGGVVLASSLGNPNREDVVVGVLRAIPG